MGLGLHSAMPPILQQNTRMTEEVGEEQDDCVTGDPVGFEVFRGMKAIGGWVGGWINGWIGGWVSGWMDAWMDGWMDACMDRWMGKWMDGWVGGWMDGWMHGWMDGHSEFFQRKL